MSGDIANGWFNFSCNAFAYFITKKIVFFCIFLSNFNNAVLNS